MLRSVGCCSSSATSSWTVVRTKFPLTAASPRSITTRNERVWKEGPCILRRSCGLSCTSTYIPPYRLERDVVVVLKRTRPCRKRTTASLHTQASSLLFPESSQGWWHASLRRDTSNQTTTIPSLDHIRWLSTDQITTDHDPDNDNDNDNDNDTDNEELNLKATDSSDTPPAKPQKPSPLTLLPPSFTPGQAQQVLQTKASKAMGHTNSIRQTEVQDLCLSARPGYIRDAKVIVSFLKVIKRCNSHLLMDWTAHAAIRGMITATTLPPHKNDNLTNEQEDAKLSESLLASLTPLNAGMFVGRAILQQETGLSVSVATKDVESVLELLLEGVKTYNPPAANQEEDHDTTTTTPPPPTNNNKKKKKHADYWSLHPSKNTPYQAMQMAKRLIHVLLIRNDAPERFLKKRAARKYKRQAMTTDGPSSRTVHLATEICLQVGRSEDAIVAVLEPFRGLEEKKWRLEERRRRRREEEERVEEKEGEEGGGFVDPILEDTYQIVRAARRKEKERAMLRQSLSNEAKETEMEEEIDEEDGAEEEEEEEDKDADQEESPQPVVEKND